MKLLSADFLKGIIFQEIKSAKSSARKYLLAAMALNIPVFGFIPYLTQAGTIVLLAIFIRQRRSSITENNQGTSAIPRNLYFLCFGTMLFQVFWMPFVSQLITLALLGIIYSLAD